MTPKHTNPTRPRVDRKNARTQWAHAPYNFVPLPEKVVTARKPLDHDEYKGLTGWIECQLETCSPLYVGGMLTDVQFKEDGRAKADELTVKQKKERAPFFSTTEAQVEGHLEPVIPGSSLRGMIRMLVEIVGYGRMRWVTDQLTFTFRAVAAPRSDPLREPYEGALGRFGQKVKAGYLEYRKKKELWYVCPARRPQDIDFPERGAYLKVKERQIGSQDIPGYLRLNSPYYRPQLHQVSFEARSGRGKRGKYALITQIGPPDAGYKYQGVLVCSGNMLETGTGSSPRKNHALVLERNIKAEPLIIRPQVVKDYLNGLTRFQKEELRDWGGLQGCLRDGAPVFYVAEGNEVAYFGHNPNFRVPAQLEDERRAATPRDFVPSEIREIPEAEPSPEGVRTCLADAIFGWVEERDGPKGERAGRVFFSDAHFIEAKASPSPELAKEGRESVWFSPKPITPRVFASPAPTTFQHYLVQDREKGHDPDDKSSLAHYGTPPIEETQIRGHKLYWHQGVNPNIEATFKQRMHERQLTRIMPVKPGVQFSFKVHFENLREVELGALWWALALPGEAGKSYRHKIGMGKPLGMGAIAISPKLYLTNRQKRYNNLFKACPDAGMDDFWDEAVREANAQPYLDAFEKHVLEKIGSDKEHLSEVKRIQMLLAMLQWRERSKEWDEQTRYMEIEHGYKEVNEYKERPVLPEPLEVAKLYTEPQSVSVNLPPTDVPAGYQSGVVKKFGLGAHKTYGFILPDEGKEDIFVHRTQLRGGLRTLQVGQRVTFRVIKTLRGQLEARNIRLEKIETNETNK